ncbi:MAG: SRPBCC family protein [Planctomycetota bacterium]|jgi:uncharacterized protein YndB with AHSA1/START domain
MSQDITYVIYIIATPDEVWAALTQAEHTRQYFFDRRIESEWNAGAQVLYLNRDGRVDIQGRVIVCDEPRLLSYSWRVMWLDEYRGLPEAIVTFQIDPLGDIVRLTLTEAHPTAIDEKYLDGARRGWPYILSGLKTLLETGAPLPALPALPSQ